MKTFSSYFLVLIVFLSISKIAYSQGFNSAEFMIVNQTETYYIMIRMYPIGAIFNGNKEYSMFAKNPIDPSHNNKYIGGFQDTLETSDPNFLVRANFDDDHAGGTLDGIKFSVGYGLYKIEFWRQVNDTGDYNYLIDTCYMDWRDAGFRVGGHFPGGFNNADLRIDCYNDTTIGFSYNCCATTFVNISSVNRHIKFWELKGTSLEDSIVVPLKGPFYSTSLNYYTSHYPIVATDNVYSFVTVSMSHIKPGDLDLNLIIDDDVTTRDTLITNPTDIIISANTSMKILYGNTFDMKPSVGGMNILTVGDSADLVIAGTLIVGNHNMLSLKSNGFIKVSNNLIFKRQSTFCNEGGLIDGRGTVTYEKGYNNYNHNLCNQSADYFVRDSVKFVLEDSVDFEIPDSVTMHFTGKETALIMNPHSKLKLGVGSKIVFDSSATLKANGATFTSLDSNDLWEGIVFNNSGYDTIKNCTFRNAKTSISIINSGDFSYLRRILRDNIFYVPSGGDYKGIYGENNYRITIAGNTFNMPVVSSGSYIYTGIYLKNSSTSGIQMEDEEPVPQYMMNIVNNVFNNGSTSIILANYISTLSTYYVGKNTFNNAADINLIA